MSAGFETGRAAEGFIASQPFERMAETRPGSVSSTPFESFCWLCFDSFLVYTDINDIHNHSQSRFLFSPGTEIPVSTFTSS
jgi:hypothetical protein